MYVPLISVIIPVYNVEKYLPKCIESVINQTYKNLEIILIDDGSTDNSGKICEEYAIVDKRIKVIHQKNTGVAEARINGFNHSAGELITFIDSDDYVEAEYLADLVAVYKKYNVDLICSQYYDVFENGKIVQSVTRPKTGYYNRENIICLLKNTFLFDKKLGIAGMNPFLWSKLIKRKYVENTLKVGKRLFYSEDQIGVLSLLYSISTMYVTDKAYYYYIRRGNQATKTYRSDLGDNIEHYFNKITELDTQGYLVNQVILRKILYTIWLTNIAIDNCESYNLVKILNRNSQYQFYKDALNYNTNYLKMKLALLLFLLKYRFFRIYIIAYKLKKSIKVVLNLIIK